MSFEEFNCNKFNIYKRYYLNLKEVAEEIEFELEQYINYLPGIYIVGDKIPIPLDRLCILDRDLVPIDLVVPDGSFEEIVTFLTSIPKISIPLIMVSFTLSLQKGTKDSNNFVNNRFCHSLELR